eukprot:6188202-Pleurochrysis_carterae.AAC.6
MQSISYALVKYEVVGKRHFTTVAFMRIICYMHTPLGACHFLGAIGPLGLHGKLSRVAPKTAGRSCCVSKAGFLSRVAPQADSSAGGSACRWRRGAGAGGRQDAGHKQCRARERADGKGESARGGGRRRGE